jgi:hypothetical protein
MTKSHGIRAFKKYIKENPPLVVPLPDDVFPPLKVGLFDEAGNLVEIHSQTDPRKYFCEIWNARQLHSWPPEFAPGGRKLFAGPCQIDPEDMDPIEAEAYAAELRERLKKIERTMRRKAAKAAVKGGAA